MICAVLLRLSLRHWGQMIAWWQLGGQMVRVSLLFMSMQLCFSVTFAHAFGAVGFGQ